MSDIVIHHIKISYDESHERVRNFVKYLESPEMKEEMNAYYDEARHSEDNKIYLEDKKGNEFTMICKEGHNCTLRLRGFT